MNHDKYLNRTLPLFSLFLRHFIPSIISIVLVLLMVVVAYFGLLIIAMIRNSGLGGPLALPFLLIVGGVSSLVYTAFLLFPSVLIAEIISLKLHTQKLVVQALISTIILAILVFIVAFGIRQLPNYESKALLKLADYPLQIYLILLIPLCFYLLIMKTSQIVINGIVNLFENFWERGTKTTGHN